MPASGEGLVEFLDMMRLMRERCAWKGSQTHASLARYLREESAEVLEAIEEGDAEHLREELGDLLLQVYFHAAIAEEAGEFTMDDVIAGLAAKMRRRNPHVFGPGAASGRRYTIEEVEELWQAAKAAEREAGGVSPSAGPSDGDTPPVSDEGDGQERATPRPGD